MKSVTIKSVDISRSLKGIHELGTGVTGRTAWNKEYSKLHYFTVIIAVTSKNDH